MNIKPYQLLKLLFVDFRKLCSREIFYEFMQTMDYRTLIKECQSDRNEDICKLCHLPSYYCEYAGFSRVRTVLNEILTELKKCDTSDLYSILEDLKIIGKESLIEDFEKLKNIYKLVYEQNKKNENY